MRGTQCGEVQVGKEDILLISFVVKKKRDYVGKIPKLGGGLFTKLFLACQNDSEVLKHGLQKGGR